jgi:hypothetical protein
MDWGIGFQSDLAPHKRSTSVHPVMGSAHLGSSEHSDFQLRGLEIIGVLNHLMLRGGVSLSSYL